jgi:arylsulfatase A-like enzyme
VWSAVLGLVICTGVTAALPERPNIVWIVSEDASAHIGCYGETTIRTPHLDAMARDGVRFTRAFVTCPVCSPSRSAMVSGMYQTTLGAHNHRSQRDRGKGEAAQDYVASYRLPENLRLIPQLFREAGYYVVNGGKAKTDYNFLEDPQLYDGRDWAGREPGQPFFAQIQLHGGKNRGAKVAEPTDPADVVLPPYYPDDPVLRADWAAYLNSWVACDTQVGELRERLRAEGIEDETIVFFWTDHGISHARGKQFLYDEGIHVPLIVWFPGGHLSGTTREDLVSHIDVAATSLALAGIEVPGYVQGRPLFAEGHQPRRYVFSARDRCDETADLIRSVRTTRFKYIRNFFAHVSHMQPNQYKDNKLIVQRLRALHAAGQLTPLQAQIFDPVRPPEELYDLEQDPDETVNLLTARRSMGHKDTLNALKLELYQWMIDSGDVGLIPEPILEELGREHGSKLGVRSPQRDSRLMWTLFETVEAAERKDSRALVQATGHAHPAVRWWGATGLGLCDDPAGIPALHGLLDDPSAGVIVAAAQALCHHGDVATGLPVLQREITNANYVVGMYAIRGLEQIGAPAAQALPAITAAQQSPYEFTERIARRLSATLAAP